MSKELNSNRYSVYSLRYHLPDLLKKDYEEHLKDYYCRSAFWSKSYCIISTGGATIETI